MHYSIAPSGAPTVPVYLPELPESVVEVPPVETRIPELPCDRLSWRNFEQLVFRLARKNADVVYCARYGRSGQAQDGIDVYARLSGGRHVCWQARNRKEVSASDIEKAVDDFLQGKWAASAERFVLCVRASLADTGLQNTIEAQAARLLEEDIVFEGVDGTQLSEKLRSHPEIIDDYFGRSWLVAFAGEEAAASLKRPLEVQRVIALREMRTGDSPVHYLVGTPKGRLSKFEKKFLTLPWQAVRPSVDVKLLSHDSELYILARSHPRTLKERAMRRRRLKKLWRRLHELQQQTLTRDALLLKLGAANKEAGRAYHLVDIQIPDPKQPVTPETFTFSLRRDKLRTVRRREGRYLLRSNLRDEDPATLWQSRAYLFGQAVQSSG